MLLLRLGLELWKQTMWGRGPDGTPFIIILRANHKREEIRAEKPLIKMQDNALRYSCVIDIRDYENFRKAREAKNEDPKSIFWESVKSGRAF